MIDENCNEKGCDTMNLVYHPGELKVQTRAGVVEAAKSVSRMIYPLIAHVFVDFIQSQPMVILGSVDANGMVWTSILCGKPGFMKVKDELTLKIEAGRMNRIPYAATCWTAANLACW